MGTGLIKSVPAPVRDEVQGLPGPRYQIIESILPGRNSFVSLNWKMDRPWAANRIPEAAGLQNRLRPTRTVTAIPPGEAHAATHFSNDFHII